MNKEHLNKDELKIVDILKEVLDPEMMVNIIDLGLVYNIQYQDTKHIQVTMTLTSQGCPLGEVIIENVRQLLLTHFSEHEVNVSIVWEPKWTIENITSEGRKSLGKLN